MEASWSPVVYLMDNGEDGLREKLGTFERSELLKVISREHMDHTNCRFRCNDSWLIDRIVEFSVKRANKGDAFRDC